MKIRTTKTSSGATAVQVVEYINYKRKILSHIGSANTEDELFVLKQAAYLWIEQHSKQSSLFDIDKSQNKSSSCIVSIDKCSYTGFRYNFFYETILKICYLFKFHLLSKDIKDIFIDLVIVRLIEPDSKVRSLDFISDFFGITHHRSKLYRKLKVISELKDDVESKVINFARKRLNFDFSLVFYDLTTLYFESFKDDELRKNGFSKDNKINQPQIMIGLLVNKDGFPISYEIFPGNKFEGHTMIPIINDLLKKYKIKKQNISFVADAAMINNENINYLLSKNFNFIVGARIANLNEEIITDISNNLNKEDNKIFRINDQKQKDCHLITQFSSSRYRRDKSDMNKQIMKAGNLLNSRDPSQINKRAKFLTKSKNNIQEYELNKKLIAKTEKLLGIKGYYTNLPTGNSQGLTDLDIIKKYRNLWQVEKSFRISKSDLRMRPIYHYKDYTIKSHILICFMALAIAKYIEIRTDKSIKYNIDLLKSVTDARIINQINNQEFLLRSKVSDDIKNTVEQITH